MYHEKEDSPVPSPEPGASLPARLPGEEQPCSLSAGAEKPLFSFIMRSRPLLLVLSTVTDDSASLVSKDRKVLSVKSKSASRGLYAHEDDGRGELRRAQAAFARNRKKHLLPLHCAMLYGIIL